MIGLAHVKSLSTNDLLYIYRRWKCEFYGSRCYAEFFKRKFIHSYVLLSYTVISIYSFYFFL